MKTFKLTFIFFLIEICVASVHAQQQFRYMLEVSEGTKVIPYVMNPQLSRATQEAIIRWNGATVARPNVVNGVSRAVTVEMVKPVLVAMPTQARTPKLIVQDREARLATNLIQLGKLARIHRNKLPMREGDAGFDLRKQVMGDVASLKARGLRNHSLVKRYERLLQAHKKQLDQEVQQVIAELISRMEANLTQLEEIARAHDDKLPIHQEDEGFEVRKEISRDITALKVRGIKEHPLFERYNRLLEANKFAKLDSQDREARLATNLIQLEEIARTHDNKLPMREGDAGFDLRRQVMGDVSSLKARGLGTHPLVERYEQLMQAHRQQLDQEARQSTEEFISKMEVNLTQLEEIARAHDNKLPIHQGDEGFDLRKKISRDVTALKLSGFKNHPLIERYSQLLDANARIRRQELAQIRVAARAQRKTPIRKTPTQAENQLERNLRQQKREYEQRKAEELLLLQDASWKTSMEETTLDPAEDADKAAALSEEQIAFPGDVATDEYINQLLLFYNKLDPFGNGTVQ